MVSEAGAPPAVGAAAAEGPSRRLLVGLLIALTAAAPLSMQIFLPALPAIQAQFGVSTGTAQLALSLSILANAFATLAYGPLSDRFGRRPTVLAGMGLFVIGSAISALAPDVITLVLARILQSVGAASGMVLARAIVRDLYDREQAATMIAYLTMAMVVVPMLSPVVGALLIDHIGWRAIFVLVSIAALALAIVTAKVLIETRPAEAASMGGGLFQGAGKLLRSAPFLAYMLQSTFAMTLFFSFIAGAPYFMINVLGRPATDYGLYFMMVASGFMVGNLTSARITRRVGIDRMILIGSVLAVLAISVATVLLAIGIWHPLALFLPMMATAYSNGLTVPNAQAGGVSVDRLLAGTASGLQGFAQMATAAVASQAVGMLMNQTPYPMIAFMSASAALSLIGFVIPMAYARRRPRG